MRYPRALVPWPHPSIAQRQLTPGVTRVSQRLQAGAGEGGPPRADPSPGALGDGPGDHQAARRGAEGRGGTAEGAGGSHGTPSLILVVEAA